MIAAPDMLPSTTRTYAFPNLFEPVRIVPDSKRWRRALVRQTGAAGTVAVSASPDDLRSPPVGPGAFIFLAPPVPFIVPPNQALYAARIAGLFVTSQLVVEVSDDVPDYVYDGDGALP